jgi:hypothetical protein
VAPSGGSFDYSRTFTLDSATMSALTAGKGVVVVVVHGLDPATLSKKAQGEKSDLVPSLPLAATSPALCGVLTASQMSTTPQCVVARTSLTAAASSEHGGRRRVPGGSGRRRPRRRRRHRMAARRAPSATSPSGAGADPEA